MIVVCKKYRCLEQSKGEFKKTEHMKLIRENLKLEKSYVDEANRIMKTSGIYYEIDKEATKERDEKLNPKKEPAKRGPKPKETK